MSNGPRETAYDEHIEPLMAQILEHCNKARIPMLAQFELDADPESPDDPLLCTSYMYGKDFEPHSDRIPRLVAVAKPRPTMMGLKVMDKDGQVIHHEIIVDATGGR